MYSILSDGYEGQKIYSCGGNFEIFEFCIKREDYLLQMIVMKEVKSRKKILLLFKLFFSMLV